MRLEDYRAGIWKRQFQYESFFPSPVNHDWCWEDPRINVLLEKATHALGSLNAFSLIVPNVDPFIHMHIIKEAQTSSRIEGTCTEITDALMPEEAILPEKRNDWREVKNYVEAMNMAIERLERLPVSNRLLCQTHEILMRGVRGEMKNPGEIRTQQNWIGGSGPMNAVFVPPHPDELPELMSDLEKFLHNEEVAVPSLIRAAIAHYQFETIHPFNDGNGRIGRLLITLFLVSKGVLNKPSLYLSDFFDRNRSAYIDSLMRVRTANDLNHWVRFFLGGVLEVAEKGCRTFQSLIKMREELEARFMNRSKRTRHILSTLNYLYRQPVISAKSLGENIMVSSPTAHAIIRELEAENILVEITERRRDRLFVFDRYLKLFVN